ncbi:MAG TPA: FHA domain-containing protein [Pyrinomonadaceae bacterium]
MNRSRENSYWLFMTDSDDPTGKLKEEQAAKKKREEALPERILRRVLEGMGSVVDRRLGRTVEPRSGLTTSKLIERMKKLIDERVRDEGRKGRIAPHHLVLKVEWGTHSEAPPEILNDLKNEVLAAAIDHINDHRYRTLAPVDVEAEVDIFTTGISVDPNFGEFEEDLRRQDEEARAAKTGVPIPGAAPTMPDIEVIARVTTPGGTREVPLIFKPGGRRLNVGRASDNDLTVNDASISKIHAALLMTSEGTLLVADTGSTNGTYINGRRIAYGESRLIEDGDVVGFGDVEVRLRKSE